MSQVELRQAEPGGPIELRGYPSVIEAPYEVGSFTETIKANAFRRSLKNNPDVVLVLEHRGLALASTRPVNGAPTLTLSEDSRGLHATATLNPEDPDARLLKAKSA